MPRGKSGRALREKGFRTMPARVSSSNKAALVSERFQEIHQVLFFLIGKTDVKSIVIEV
jgi:hypothetical protein